MSIRGLQNYILLAEANVIKKPDVTFGVTNPEMAIVAERFGLLSDAARQHPTDPDKVHKDMRQMKKLKG